MYRLWVIAARDLASALHFPQTQLSKFSIVSIYIKGCSQTLEDRLQMRVDRLTVTATNNADSERIATRQVLKLQT